MSEVALELLRFGSGTLVSFDIDGTLESGDPPGGITMDMVRKALDLGYLVGSCSDKPINASKTS